MSSPEFEFGTYLLRNGDGTYQSVQAVQYVRKHETLLQVYETKKLINY